MLARIRTSLSSAFARRAALRLAVRSLATAALLLACAAAAEACPTCKESLAANDPHHQQMVAGYFYSILFMMSMPFLLLGGFGTYAWLLVRRARRAELAAEAAA